MSLIAVASSTSNVPLSTVLPPIVVSPLTTRSLCNVVFNSTSNVSLIVVASSTSSVPFKVVFPPIVVLPSIVVLSFTLNTPVNVVSAPTFKSTLTFTSPCALKLCVYILFQCLSIVPRSYDMLSSGIISLLISALNTTTSVSVSPTVINPLAPALRYALPSTRISPITCRLLFITTSPPISTCSDMLTSLTYMASHCLSLDPI